jgi:hypothetical protein
MNAPPMKTISRAMHLSKKYGKRDIDKIDKVVDRTVTTRMSNEFELQTDASNKALMHRVKALDDHSHALGVIKGSNEELMKPTCVAHSLLKPASLIESRLKVRSTSGLEKILPSTGAWREAVKSIRICWLPACFL